MRRKRVSWRWAAWIFGTLLGLAFHSAALAAPVYWTMTATFADGGTLNGSFVFDADTVVATNWSLSVAGGNTATFAPITYTPLDSVYETGGIIDGHTILEFMTLDSTRYLFFLFNPDLTDAGGSTNVFISPGNAGELVIASQSGSRDISSGTAEGTVVLPEPGTLALLSIGFLVGGLFSSPGIPISTRSRWLIVVSPFLHRV